MNPTLPFLALLAITTLLGLLPLLPALIELLRKTDVAPLRIVHDHDGNVGHFARRLRTHVQSRLPAQAAPKPPSASIIDGFLDGTPFHLIHGTDERCESGGARAERHGRGVLFSPTPLVLPEQTLVLLEIYALETLRGGVESVYRALLGERDLYLARGTTVLRWLHSEGDTHVERGSTLYGRASAGHLLHLAQCCRFQRLHAPRIEFGTLPALPPPAPARLPLKPLILPDIVEVAGRRWLVKGDLEIPPGSSFDGDLVVKGRLFVGSGSRITGSLKSHKQMVIGRGSHVAGSAVSSHSLFIGAACRVKGPLIAEQEVVVAAGSRLGAWDQPTTMTAPHIRVAPSVVVFGTVWAQVSGYVCSEESMAPFLHP